MATATLLLPARSRFGAAAALPEDIARALGRAGHTVHDAGELAQLRRHFDVDAPTGPGAPSPGLAAAALTRQLDAGDAADALWLRADPAHIVPDMHGARMMGHGDSLHLSHEDAVALLPDLQPVFAAHGLVFDAPSATRWYLRVPAAMTLPLFDSPDDVLGDDLFNHLPAGEDGRRWRALLTESQVVLHAHPRNAERIAQGLGPVNSLWFWGAGRLPARVQTAHAQVRSRDALLRALATAAGVQVDGEQSVDALVDLRAVRSLPQLASQALQPLLAALGRGELRRLVLDFEDGTQFTLDRSQRWQFWKKARQLQDP